jgi:hypothetical protein
MRIINGLPIGTRVLVKGIGEEAVVIGPHTEAWQVRLLHDGRLYNVDSFDIAAIRDPRFDIEDSPRFGDGRPEDTGLPEAVNGEPLAD